MTKNEGFKTSSNSGQGLFNSAQAKASDPDLSVWVSASAGTGKTKILTDRVLRLMLQGVDPRKIFCITFTKAAASEMKNRINKQLAIWANTPINKLQENLSASFGGNFTKAQTEIASSLLHNILSLPEQVNIQTIHSLCLFLLRKFPLEAGISPKFKVVNEYKTEEISRKIRHKLINYTHDNPECEISISFKFILENLHSESIFKLIQDIIEEKNKFKSIFLQFPETDLYVIHLKTLFNLPFSLPKEKMEEYLIEEFIKNIPPYKLTPEELREEDLKTICNYLSYSTIEKVSHFEKIVEVFLTKTGEKRKKIFNKKLSQKFPELEAFMYNLQEEIFHTLEHIKSVKIINFTKNLFNIAGYIINEYENYKSLNSFLDYDDLIFYTRNLLTSSDMKHWVLYKLDHSIDHLLLDEAQDTSFEQWQIIEALINEFYSGLSAVEQNRTLFVVGDEKQSIYSFQGADPRRFKQMNEYFNLQMQDAGKKFVNIDLTLGYRSSDAVNFIVKEIFEDLELRSPGLLPSYSNMQIFREGQGGKIEIWPIILKQDQQEKESVMWPIPDSVVEDTNPQILLAKFIAEYIKNLLARKAFLPNKNRIVRADDIIILVRKRGTFTLQLVRELQNLKVSVAGVDRISLLDNLAIKDILSLAKFVLLPIDDLNLACLLKSPFIGFSEAELYDICINRGRKSIWEFLNDSNNHALRTLEEFIELYNFSSLSGFFNGLIDGMGFRKKLLYEIGNDSNDAINEFLELVINFEEYDGQSLQEFILWFENLNIEIKRDPENKGLLRVMTVHGSKGLQAPIVILADTTSVPKFQSSILTTDNNEILWCGFSENENYYYKTLKESYKKQEYEEYIRLLYVALTRAEDELIIFGESTEKEVNEHSWYSIINTALRKNLSPCPIASEYEKYFGGQEHYYSLNLYKKQNSPHISNLLKKNKYVPLLDVNPKFQLIKPKRLLQEKFIHSPLNEDLAIKTGIIIHKILEIFFHTKDFMKVKIHPLIELFEPHYRKEILSKLEQLASNSEINRLFNYKLLTELTVGKKLVSSDYNSYLGRIDLLAVNDLEVIIIDYKTDKNVPKDTSLIPENYINQLRGYKEAVQDVYKNKIIKTKILWFENLYLMDVAV